MRRTVVVSAQALAVLQLWSKADQIYVLVHRLLPCLSLGELFRSSNPRTLLFILAPCLFSWCMLRNVKQDSIFLNIPAFSGSFCASMLNPVSSMNHSEKSEQPQSDIVIFTNRLNEWSYLYTSFIASISLSALFMQSSVLPKDLARSV